MGLGAEIGTKMGALATIFGVLLWVFKGETKKGYFSPKTQTWPLAANFRHSIGH